MKTTRQKMSFLQKTANFAPNCIHETFWILHTIHQDMHHTAGLSLLR